ncbi:AAA family ATPase [Candidatus Kuenenia sp.]|uniref:AAA family ATPase n=1 Tax=Candidatus Kuenenia sp. TaxID=2499824 RepID=UPI00322081CD
MPKISIYKDVIDTVGIPTEMGKILSAIKNGKWKEKITELRALQDGKAQKAFKNTLPCYTPSGLFSKRNAESLISHSGALLLDFDAKDNPCLVENFKEIRNELIADPYTYFLFTSCRGNGLALGVRIEKTKHLESFLFLERYYMEKYELVVDKGCKDVCRLRFISYDPELFINENAEMVVPDVSAVKDTAPTTRHDQTSNGNVSDRETMDDIIASGVTLVDDHRHADRVKIAHALSTAFGESLGRIYTHSILSKCADYDREKTDKYFTSIHKNNQGTVKFASIVFLAKQAGYTPTGKGKMNIAKSAAEWNPWEATKVEILTMGLTHAGDLLNEPEETTDWLIEGLLPSGSFSIITAKPKVGKSTLVKQMALNIARGLPFFGREVMQGAVIYLALEDKRSEIRKHLRGMGLTASDPFYLYAGGAPVDAIKRIAMDITVIKPVLLVVDTLFRLIRLKDGNSYNEVTNALNPLILLARESGVSILAVHHSKKGDSNIDDCLLGSTAIFGSVDTTILLKRYEGYRTIQSMQRYGEDMPETVLVFDKATGSTDIGGAKMDQDIHSMENAIFEFLGKQVEPVVEKVVMDEVLGKNALKRKALRQLVKEGQIFRTGKGGKGNPFHYSCTPENTCTPEKTETGYKQNDKKNDPEKNACTLVPKYIGVQQKKKDKSGCEPHGYCEDSCTRVPVSGEQEKTQRVQANSDEKLTLNSGENADDEIPEIEFLEVK